MAIGADLLMPPNATAAPAFNTEGMTKVPEVAEDNRSKWRKFLEATQDPNFRQAMFTTGVGMMRSPQYGESGWDVAANALQSGVGTLQALRQQDFTRAQQVRERDLAERTQRDSTDVARRGAATGEANARTSATAVRQSGSNATVQADLQRSQQTETGRHNRAVEDIQRTSAESDRIRANAYFGNGTRTPADIQKINMLSAQFQAEGMDKTSADAKGVMIVNARGAGKTPGETARLLYQQAVESYMGSIEGMQKPLTPAQHQEYMDKAIADAMKLAAIDAGARGELPPTIDPQRGGRIARPAAAAPGVTVQEPKAEVARKVQALRAKGTPEPRIRYLLQLDNENPDLYGVKDQ